MSRAQVEQALRGIGHLTAESSQNPFAAAPGLVCNLLILEISDTVPILGEVEGTRVPMLACYDPQGELVYLTYEREMFKSDYPKLEIGTRPGR